MTTITVTDEMTDEEWFAALDEMTPDECCHLLNKMATLKKYKVKGAFKHRVTGEIVTWEQNVVTKGSEAEAYVHTATLQHHRKYPDRDWQGHADPQWTITKRI